jgi:Domain of unknown function (DUF4149)
VTKPRGDVITFLETCVLALWFGAALFFATIVAPAAFAVLPTAGLAGALVGRVLPSLFVSGMCVGLVIIGLEMHSPRPGRRVRGLGAGAMLAACALAQFVIGTRIERLRVAVGSPIAALAQDDPRRAAFGRLHGLSVAALGAAMVAAVAAAAGARAAYTAKG